MVVDLDHPSLSALRISSYGAIAPPVIVRIAGLPGEVLAPLSSPLCASGLISLASLEQELADCRSRLVDTLAAALASFPPSIRRFLLAAKRDAFNGRELGRYRDRPEWPELVGASAGIAERVVELESAVREAERSFAATYETERERERMHLLSLLAERNLVRGVALGNPELVAKARRLPEVPFELWGRRERKIEQTLLRFVSRTAAKLSPYSTLTSVALGAVRDDLGAESLRIVPGPRREVSLVRANRSVLDRCVEILLRHPSVRDRFEVAWNDTAREEEPGRFRFLRNGHWEIDSGEGRFRWVRPSHVSARIGGPLIERLKALLTGRPWTYAALVVELAGAEIGGSIPGEDRVRTSLDGLISLGFLQLLPPWPTHEIHLERRLLGFLRSLDAPELRDIVERLAWLVERELAHGAERSPEVSAAALDEALASLVASVEGLAGEVPKIEEARGFYDDVVLLPARGSGNRADLFQISAAQIEEILSNAELVWRFVSVFNHRHDLLHTLSVFWAERWPNRREVGFLDLFDAVHELWKDYLRFDCRLRYDNFSAFNPLKLPAIEALSALRRELYARAQDLIRETPTGSHLPKRQFAELLDGVPERYRPLFGCSVFVQPTSAQADTWMLNRLFEGTSRYLSRYIASFPAEVRDRLAAHFATRSIVEVDGEPAELLDIIFTLGNMVNMRVLQTSRAVELPGERAGLPRDRCVKLSELRVQADLSDGRFRLVDSGGRRLIPAHMSSMNFLFMPLLQRFLTIFGPYETRQVFPRPRPATVGGAEVASRLRCGNLVVRRKRWELPAENLRKKLANVKEPEAFRIVDRWRRAIELPDCVFLYEQMHRAGDVAQSYKPQYLDLSSPSFMSLFLAIIKQQQERLILEEPLPSYSDFPPDGAHGYRAIEIQIDSLALRKATFSEVDPN